MRGSGAVRHAIAACDASCDHASPPRTPARDQPLDVASPQRARSTGSNKTAARVADFRDPRRTELDQTLGAARIGGETHLESPRFPAGSAEARRGTTTMIAAGTDSAIESQIVLRNRLRVPTRASAFGLPNREENPAARITACSRSRRHERFIAFIYHGDMKKRPRELSTPALHDARLADGDSRLCAA